MTDYLCLNISYDCQLHIVQTHKDHAGNVTRPVWHVTRGKGLGYTRLETTPEGSPGPKPSPLTLCDSTLIIPCSRAVTERILNFLEFQLMTGPDRHGQRDETYGPYYFTVDMTGNEDFEGTGKPLKSLFGGPATAYKDQLDTGWFARIVENLMPSFAHQPGEENKEDIPYARYNCWTATQGLTQYIGGVDLAAIAPQFPVVYRAAKAEQTFEDLYDDLTSSYREDYETTAVSDNTVIGRYKNGAPFIMTKSNGTLDSLLDASVPNTGSTVDGFMALFPAFAPQPPKPQRGPAP